jgi:hypothetical protein
MKMSLSPGRAGVQTRNGANSKHLTEKNMKTSTLKLVTMNLALAAALAGLAGCATSKSYDKGAATSTALNDSAAAVAQTTTSVTGVLGALNDLTFKSEGDLRKQYDAFVSATKTLEVTVAKLDTKAMALQSAATAYINDWTNQLATIQSDNLRQRSVERKDVVASQLKEAMASYDKVKESLKPFLTDVKDIQTYLGTDLTAGGLATIKDIVARTKVDAVPLRDAIKRLQAGFTTLGASLSPVLPAGQK